MSKIAARIEHQIAQDRARKNRIARCWPQTLANNLSWAAWGYVTRRLEASVIGLRSEGEVG